jgi:hypothetical protein
LIFSTLKKNSHNVTPERERILNHHSQIKQRQKRIEDIDEAIRQKKLRAKNKLSKPVLPVILKLKPIRNSSSY